MRILWLKTELLHPVDKGGRIRSYQMLRHLKERHEITYMTLDDGTAGPAEVAAASEYCHELIRIPHRRAAKYTARFFWELALNIGSDLPYFLQKYRSEVMRRAIADRDATEDHDVLVCDFLVPAVNLPELERPSVLFQHNVEAEIWRRHAEIASGPLKRRYFRTQWERTRAFERAACRRFERVVAVSEQDRDTFAREYGLEDVAVVETGVDVDYFEPAGRRARDPDQIVFTGSMDWLPNEDAMTWFVDEIMPRIRARRPKAKLAIVGRDPSPPVRRLAEQHEFVTVTGTVPDIRPWVEEAAVYIVPLRIGGGTRLKIYEAMALERPVVSTSIGMEGLPVRDGQELVIADEPERFAEVVIRLLERPGEGEALGRKAAERVRRDFGWAKVAADFARLCEEARASAAAGREPPREEELATCV